MRLRPLDNETRQAWIEPYGYHFRAKHVVMQKVLEEAEVALLIDTDTFSTARPSNCSAVCSLARCCATPSA